MRQQKFGSPTGSPGVEILERDRSQTKANGSSTSGVFSEPESTVRPITSDISSISADSEVITADAF